MDKFGAVFEQQDKLELAKLRNSSSGVNTIEKRIFQQALEDSGGDQNAAIDAVMKYKQGAATSTQMGKDQPEIERGKKSLELGFAMLNNDFDELQRLGGMVDENASPEENARRSLVASDPGRFLGKVLGTKAETVRTRIDAQKPKLVLAIMQAGGASARALDSDNELKIWLNTTGDTKTSYQANKELMRRGMLAATNPEALLQELSAKAAPAVGNSPTAGGAIDYTEYFK
jgi:hypothetical protein